MKTKTFPSLLIPPILTLPLILLTSCATKGPKKVNAFPAFPTIQTPENWTVQDAPRTQPGKIMDPEATTFAQIPSRIIYLPGNNQIFGRTSPRQEISYNLIPIEKIPEVQALATPEFQKRENPPENKTPPTVFTTTFTNKEGQKVTGTARRLGVLEKTPEEEKRAAALLQPGETLQWSQETGWVGFTEENPIQNPIPIQPQTEIKPIEETEPTKPPKIDIPVDKPQKNQENQENTNLQELGLEITFPD